MNVSEVVKKRCAVREFKSKLISDDELRKILEAARWAPSPFNTQPWEFIIKSKETLKAISKYARYYPHLESAPMVIAVVVPPVNEKFTWVERIGETRFAAAMCVQNMMLAAWELGIGSCWVSIERDEVRKILNIPDTHFLLAIVPLGYPEKVPEHHERSKRLEDIVFYEMYGQKKYKNQA